MTAGGDPLVVELPERAHLDHGRLELLVDAAEAFADRYRREQRELAVSLTTAVPIDDAQAEGLRQRLESATGQTVTIRRTVDPSIVGGVVLRVRDLLVDASVRRRLEGLRLSPQGQQASIRRRSVKLRPDEIASILRDQISGYQQTAEVEEVGTVIQVGDGIARIYGLENCVAMEMLEFPHGVTGLALNLEESNVGAVLFGDWQKIAEGDIVRRTG